MKNGKYLTINEIADILRVSRHTVQAWISPSSPNHRPEFSSLARHAGRKTVFIEEEVLSWLNQRRGAIYSEILPGRSAYWREKWTSGRGLLRGVVKDPIRSGEKKVFGGGLLALDTEPLLAWLADSSCCSDISRNVEQAEGLILPATIAIWLLRRIARMPSKILSVKDFIMSSNIFELAPFNENSIQRALELPIGISELSLNAYCCSLEAGASAFYTANTTLLKTPGLPAVAF